MVRCHSTEWTGTHQPTRIWSMFTNEREWRFGHIAYNICNCITVCTLLWTKIVVEQEDFCWNEKRDDRHKENFWKKTRSSCYVFYMELNMRGTMEKRDRSVVIIVVGECENVATTSDMFVWYAADITLTFDRLPSSTYQSKRVISSNEHIHWPWSSCGGCPIHILYLCMISFHLDRSKRLMKKCDDKKAKKSWIPLISLIQLWIMVKVDVKLRRTINWVIHWTEM